METIPAVITVFFFLYSCVGSTTLASDDSPVEITINGSAKVYLPENVRTDEHFTLITCDRDKFPSKISCNVTIREPLTNNETWENYYSTSNDYSPFNDSCQINVDLGKENYLVFPLQFFSLGVTANKKILITWKEVSANYQSFNKRIGVLEMKCCELTLESFSHFPKNRSHNVLVGNTVVYPDAFDIVISDGVRCDGFDKCRITFDENGELTRGPVPFSTSLYGITIVPASGASDSEGFYVIPGSHGGVFPVAAEFISPSGVMKKLNLRNEISEHSDYKLVYSTAHKQFTLCSTLRYEIRCDQFKFNDVEPKFGVRFGTLRNTRATAVHNLDGGGLLLLTLGCREEAGFSCDSLKITELKTDGQIRERMSASISLRCSENLDNLSWVTYHKNETVCFDLLCLFETRQEGQLFKTTVSKQNYCVSAN